MALTDFTEYDDIRAILGVTPEELEDVTLGLSIYLKQLQFTLGDVEPTLEAAYLALLAQPTRSKQEQKVVDVVQVFSAYAVSKYLLTAIPLFSPKRITDGRAEQDRFAPADPFQDLRDGVDSAYQALLARLLAAIGAIGLVPDSAAGPRTYFLTSVLAIDPIIA